jgi:hypothetical protein
MYLIQWGNQIYIENKKVIKLYVTCLLVALLAYGPKLFYQSYASDDYANYMAEPNWYELNTWLGRWASSLLNYFFFSGTQHVLPYFNSLLSICLLVATGLIISITWNVKGKFPMALITLLVSLSPYWTNNLWFNVNTGVAIGFFLSSVAILILIKYDTWKYYLLGLLLLIIGAGVYQPIVETAVIIIIGSLYVKLAEVNDFKDLKKAIFQVGWLLAALVIANVISAGVNKLTLLLVNETVKEGSRYSEALNLPIRDILYLLKKLILSAPDWFGVQLPFLSSKVNTLNFLLVAIGSLGFITDSYKSKHLFFWKILILLVGTGGIIVITHIPFLLGMVVSPRAFFANAIVIALYFLLAYKSIQPLISSSIVILAVLSLFLSSLYTSLFYDNAFRQTQSDLANARSILTQIYVHEDYLLLEEAPNFIIVGKDNKDYFQVSGGQLPSAFGFRWSKYSVFKHFTNFKFKQLQVEEERELIGQLPSTLQTYPHPDAISISNNTIILVLDKKALKE